MKQRKQSLKPNFSNPRRMTSSTKEAKDDGGKRFGDFELWNEGLNFNFLQEDSALERSLKFYQTKDVLNAKNKTFVCVQGFEETREKAQLCPLLSASVTSIPSRFRPNFGGISVKVRHTTFGFNNNNSHNKGIVEVEEGFYL
ncbi:hypothetical protein L1049_009562 [Liquidambar formosana]|uniref:Uncharacterized protein n=1 Tax=Liquidambar formosana TaxID=63359 RepID=A0AAP0N6X0_LIQFO